MDTYKVIGNEVKGVIFKEKSSKFLGYAFYVRDEEEVKKRLEEVKKEHFSARHWCYAWQIGVEEKRYRANDDGEPSGTAGLPIYGQIQSFEVTNILIIVVRYFGGIKLGVGGLVQAYKTTAQMTLEECEIEERIVKISYLVNCSYGNLNKVMRIIKENNIEVVEQEMEIECKIFIDVWKKDREKVEESFKKIYDINFKEI